MRRAQTGLSFTLLEMTAVVTLLAIAVGIATMRVSGTADHARLEAAATQIGSVYRLTVCQAARSGRPRILSLDPHGCIVKEPVYRDGNWLWSPAPRIEWTGGVALANVYPFDGNNVPSQAAVPWEIIISPGAIDAAYGVVLKLPSGSEATYLLDGVIGVSTLHTEKEPPND